MTTSTLKKLILFSAFNFFLLSFPALSQAATINAQSCSQADVQAAVNQAQDGDTVMVPNGSCAWANGITTSKQIWIRAQNYIPAPGGNTTRNVVITNNASVPLFSFTTGNNYHVALSGIRINEGLGTNNHLEVNGGGSKVALISDMFFEVKDRYGNAGDVAVMDWAAQGGVIWNTRFVGLSAGTSDGVGPGGASFHVFSPRLWNSASTVGSLDANGSINLYFEDSSAVNLGQFPDADDNARMVLRYNTIDGTSGLTHGFSSTWGGRHVEYYNNVFSVTNPNRNIAGRYFWLRAGTAVFTDNVVNNASNPSAYGSPVILDIGDVYGLGPYPVSRQPGWGHNGITDVSDPIYLWNQTGARAYAYGISNGWDSNVQLNRDLFVNNGPKPGYAKYTYPHPLRAVIEGPPPPPDTQAPTTPSNLTAQAVSSSQINLSWTASTDNVGVTGYRVERCSGSSCSNYSQIATPSGTSYNDTGLTANTTYRYRVRANDAAGNLSGYSSSASATTQSRSSGNTITATSCSQSAVQAAVNVASDGDTVMIPDGSCSWSSGISTTKQIKIQAQNYTRTPGGNTSRSVIITNNSSQPLFNLTSGNLYHVGIAGIRFNEGTGNVNHIRLNGTGSKVPLINDSYFQVKCRAGDQPDIAAVAVLSQGAVFWNSIWTGESFSGCAGGVQPVGVEGASLFVESPRDWNTASTLGTLDTNGTVNVYVEDSSCVIVGQWPDIDQAGRLVMRYNTIDGCGGLTHGFTSGTGGRHFEYYNNTLQNTFDDRNFSRYFWARAGHGVITENTVTCNNTGYGVPQMLDSTCEGCSSYPTPKQVGWGHNGSISVIDPIYIWNQSGGSCRYDWDTSEPTYIQLNREIYVNSGAKPGYSKYTYPHPLQGGTLPPDTTPPASPTGLTVQ